MAGTRKLGRTSDHRTAMLRAMVTFLLEKGRIETSTFFEGEEHRIIVRHRDGRVEEITCPKFADKHSGGDERMVAMLFGGLEDDPLGQCSDSFDGIKSAMIGIAANKSIKEGVRVELTPILDKMR